MKDLGTLFKDQDTQEGLQAPARLEDRVLISVREAAKAEDRKDHIVWGGFFLASVGFFCASIMYAVREFSTSSFGRYFSLIFSDLGSAMHGWKELSLSLLESLPVAGVVLVLASIVLVLFTIRKYSRRGNSLIIHSYARIA